LVDASTTPSSWKAAISAASMQVAYGSEYGELPAAARTGNRFETGGGSPLLPFSIPHRERSSCQAAWMDGGAPVISEQYISDAHDS